MAAMRIYLAILLSLCLGLTSQTMALARGMETPAGEMVLCVGTQTVTVYYDDQGQPVSAPHYCPDCSAVQDAAVLVNLAPRVERPLGTGVQLRRELLRWRLAQAVRAATARGPPVLV